MTKKNSAGSTQPLAYSVKEAISASSLSRTTLYAAIRDKRLRVTRHGRRTLILASSLRALIGDTEDPADQPSEVAPTSLDREA